MWRIEFTAGAIKAVTGRDSFYLANGIKRSDQVLVFKHEPGGRLNVRSVILGSADFSELVAKSTKVDAAKRTVQGASGRGYGVF